MTDVAFCTVYHLMVCVCVCGVCVWCVGCGGWGGWGGGCGEVCGGCGVCVCVCMCVHGMKFGCWECWWAPSSVCVLECHLAESVYSSLIELPIG